MQNRALSIREGLNLGQLLGEGQESEDDGLLALLEDRRGLLRGQLRAEKGSKEGVSRVFAVALGIVESHDRQIARSIEIRR